MGEPLGQKYAKFNEEMVRLLEKGDIGPEFEKLRKESHQIESTIVDRNLEGKQLEKQGEVDKAIILYEQNVSDEADTPYSYKRLAILYDKAGRYQDAIRVLERAILVFRGIDKQKDKLAKFIERLEKVKSKAK